MRNKRKSIIDLIETELENSNQGAYPTIDRLENAGWMKDGGNWVSPVTGEVLSLEQARSEFLGYDDGELGVEPQQDVAFRAEAREFTHKLKSWLRELKDNPLEDMHAIMQPVTDPRYRGGIMFAANRVDSRYKGLYIIMLPADKKDGAYSRAGGFGRSPDGKTAVITVHNLLGYYSLKHCDTRLDTSVFVHEFIHYLDAKREKRLHGSGFSSKKLRGGDESAYFNDAGEYNAYFQEMASSLDSFFRPDSMLRSSPETFRKYSTWEGFKEVAKKIASNRWQALMDEKYQKKFLRRLYALWQHLTGGEKEPMKENTQAPVVLYHLTDKPRFKLSNVTPSLNYTSWDYPEGSAIYLTDSPEYWWNGHNYIRPFVAEVQCNFDVNPYKARFGHEWRIPSSKFPECKVLRVIPTDEWFGEEYGSTYTTQEERPKGFKFPEDVREWPIEKARKVSSDVRAWSKREKRGHYAESLKESPEDAFDIPNKYRFSYTNLDAVAFGIKPDGTVHVGGQDDVPEAWDTPLSEYGSIMTHRRLVGLFELGDREHDYGTGKIPVTPAQVYKYSGRAWKRVRNIGDTQERRLYISFWNGDEVPEDAIQTSINVLSKKYGMQFDKVLIQTRSDDNDEWSERSASPKKRGKAPSAEMMKLRDLERQLHMADPSQKAFIRRGIEIMKAKMGESSVQPFISLFESSGINDIRY